MIRANNITQAKNNNNQLKQVIDNQDFELFVHFLAVSCKAKGRAGVLPMMQKVSYVSSKGSVFNFWTTINDTKVYKNRNI